MEAITSLTSRKRLVLPYYLWYMFYKQKLIRTWDQDLLYRADPMDPPATTFAFNIKRLIQGLLQIERDTKRSHLVFVDFHMEDGPTVYYHEEKNTFYISRYWLDYTAVHEVYPCRVSVHSQGQDDKIANSHLFRCDHVVMALYGAIMEAAARDLSDDDVAERVWMSRRCQAAHQRLVERPQMISMQLEYLEQGDVCVQWEKATLASMDEVVGDGWHVVVHRVDCMAWQTQYAHYHSMFSLLPCPNCPTYLYSACLVYTLLSTCCLPSWLYALNCLPYPVLSCYPALLSCPLLCMPAKIQTPARKLPPAVAPRKPQTTNVCRPSLTLLLDSPTSP